MSFLFSFFLLIYLSIFSSQSVLSRLVCPHHAILILFFLLIYLSYIALSQFSPVLSPNHILLVFFSSWFICPVLSPHQFFHVLSIPHHIILLFLFSSLLTSFILAFQQYYASYCASCLSSAYHSSFLFCNGVIFHSWLTSFLFICPSVLGTSILIRLLTLSIVPFCLSCLHVFWTKWLCSSFLLSQ